MRGLAGYSEGATIYVGADTLIVRARRLADDRCVVIKKLNARYPTAQQIACFEHEYRVLHRLRDCPVVLDVLDLHGHGGALAMVLEDFSGLPLTQESESFNGSPSARLLLAIALAEALGEMHQRDTIHNALTPENILWDPQQRKVKLIDFALATRARDLGLQFPAASDRPAVLAYVSPEQTGRLNRRVDQRSDLYSLGVTLYQLFCNALPFASKDPMALIHAHIAAQPKHPGELMSGPGSEVLSDIIVKLLSKNPEARYQSASGLAHDLARLRDAIASGDALQEIRLEEADFSGQLPGPARLYGREAEVDALNAAFEQACQGHPRLIMVAGYSGIGKSTLVYDMRGHFFDRRAYFCVGKSGQFERHNPYGAISKAGEALIRQVLTEPHARLQEWREQLLENLGANAQLIVEIIPELALIIGPQPAVKPLTSEQAQNRFHATFRSFLRTFARADHPLVLFLDDLQWSDLPTLQLIQNLLLTPELEHFLLIGAYRDHELDAQHALLATVARIKQQCEVQTLSLGPFNHATLSRMLADRFRREPEVITPLANLIDAKTRGNPFFIEQVLDRLHQDQALRFDYRADRWEWDLDRLVEVDISGNVVELIIARLRRISGNARDHLRLASCLGNSFDWRTLTMISDRDATRTAAAIIEFIDSGIVFPLDESHQQVKAAALETGPVGEATAVQYRFEHDQVQQAAYSFIEDTECSGVHLANGRLMLRNMAPDERKVRVIEIVRQLNLGRQAITEPSELTHLAEMNLQAGRKAKLAAAYRPALEYFTIGRQLLTDSCWTSSYALAAEIVREYAECAYICGDFQAAEKYSRLLLERCKTDLERAGICHYRRSSTRPTRSWSGRSRRPGVDCHCWAKRSKGIPPRR